MLCLAMSLYLGLNAAIILTTGAYGIYCEHTCIYNETFLTGYKKGRLRGSFPLLELINNNVMVVRFELLTCHSMK